MKKKEWYIIAAVSGVLLLLSIFFLQSINQSIDRDREATLAEIGAQTATNIMQQADREITEIQLAAAYFSKAYQEVAEIDVLSYIAFLEQQLIDRRIGIVLYREGAVYADGEKRSTDAILWEKWRGKKNEATGRIIENVNGEKVSIYGVPIVVDGKIIGELYGIMNGLKFIECIQYEKKNEAISSFIVDAGGEAVIVLDQLSASSTLGGQLPKEEKVLLRELMENLQVEKDGGSYRVGSKQIVFTPLGNNGWHVVNVAGDSFLGEGIKGIFGFSLFVGVSIVGIGISCCLWILWIRYKNNKEVLQAVYTDEIVDLYSGRGFEVMAQKILRQTDQQYFIVDCELYHFENYYLLFGLESGERLLQYMARTLGENFKRYEICGRAYSSRFLILLQADTTALAMERIKEMQEAYFDSINEITLQVRYGICPVPSEQIAVATLVNCAATARRKVFVEASSDQYIRVYNEQMHAESVAKDRIINQLSPALESGEFTAYYQPKYNIATEEVMGAEALVRWIKPDGEMILPDQFIPLCEETGLIAKVDFYVLRCACKLLKELKDAGLPMVPISVNFSRVHLYDEHFVSHLYSVVSAYDIETKWIEIEFTETTIVEDIQYMMKVLEELHQLAFVVNMDDFGSGYSSLNILRHLKIDILKIDKAFLKGIETDDRGKAIIEGIVHMSQVLQVATVAEGVETKEHLAFLKEVGCDIAQGYYFSKPLPAACFVALLKENRTCMQRFVEGEYGA